MLYLRLIQNEDVAVESRSKEEAGRNNQKGATEFLGTHHEKRLQGAHETLVIEWESAASR